QNPLLRRTNFSLDWYDIIINHTIAFTTLNESQSRCYSNHYVLDSSGNVDPTALAAALADRWCSVLNRRNVTDGTESVGYVPYDNLGYQQTDGVDAQFNWGADFADMGLKAIPGAINVNLLANYLMDWRTNANPKDPSSLTYNFVGTNTYFRYQLNSTLTYIEGPATISLNWRHWPGVRPTTYATTKAALEAIAGGNAPIGPPAPPFAADQASHDEFSLSGTWSLNGRSTLRAGVENLFDAKPEITGAAAGGFNPNNGGSWVLPTSGAGTTDISSYDVLG